jgi:hypothetical protein
MREAEATGGAEMRAGTKIVIGVVSLVAVWLTLATTLFAGTGSVEPRPGQHPTIVRTVPALESEGDATDLTIDGSP